MLLKPLIKRMKGSWAGTSGKSQESLVPFLLVVASSAGHAERRQRLLTTQNVIFPLGGSHSIARLMVGANESF
jgi:hypothetical protein